MPECGTNLNADYPGAPEGGVGARIANFFVKEIFPKIDFLIDLHSGGRMEPLTPCLFFPVGAGAEVMKESLAAAKATNIPNLIASTAKTGHYSYAAGMGVPGLLLERGYGELCKPKWAANYVEDLRLLLKHFELLPGGEEGVCSKKSTTGPFTSPLNTKAYGILRSPPVMR